ncbi:hypothetical protein B0H14DRAFT_3142891 [Mycena olivaceomarginata]|nr:hypothetical protein B0H14DRAFT_3142891 [Mycena olivaceomarginata]
MTLYTLRVPRGLPQVCRYDNGTGDVLSVPLGTTAFVAGKTVWGVGAPSPGAEECRHARARHSTRLGLECDGIEVELGALPPWEEVQRKTLPVLWKNPVTGELAFQVHPCGAVELLINSLPESAAREAALYPDGVHLTDLKEVRDLLYTMQHLNYLILPVPKYYAYFALKRLRKKRVFQFIVIGIQCSGCYTYFYA